MFSLGRPSPELLDALLRNVRGKAPSYPFVGLTRGGPPQQLPYGFKQLVYKTQVGQGPEMLALAGSLLWRWHMYETSFTSLHGLDVLESTGPSAPSALREPEPGLEFAVLVKHLGFWSANPLRVVYTISNSNRIGFGVGTLPGHAEAGEERFLVKMDSAGLVWFEIFSLSRPEATLAQLGSPFVLNLQKQFCKDAMRQLLQVLRADPRYPKAKDQFA